MLYTDTIEHKSSCSQAERIAGGRRNYEPTARKKAEKGISTPRGIIVYAEGPSQPRCSTMETRTRFDKVQQLCGQPGRILRRMHHGLAICRVHLVQPLHTESTDDDEIGNDYARGDSIEYCPGRYQNNDETVTNQSISI